MYFFIILNIRYDKELVGLSTGDQNTLEFEHWVEDAVALVDRVCQGPVILVASSVGSWVMIRNFNTLNLVLILRFF